MKNYTLLKIFTNPPLDDEFAAIFWAFNPAGITIEDSSISIYFDNESPITIDLIRQELENLKFSGLLTEFTIVSDSIENKNWNQEWQQNLRVIHVSENVTIKPTFREYIPKNDNEIVIEIDPKMAFGTGEHETTRLVVSLLEKYSKDKNFVLDAGCGSGVLAIASVKLGAEKALAFDNDEWCTENCLENFVINGVTESIEYRCCEINSITESNFDLIIANIQKNVLIPLLNEFKVRLLQNGLLILSGLLKTDFEEINFIYSNAGFKLLEHLSENEWIALVYKLE